MMAVWSEVLFSEIPKDLRFDAEYYQPEYLAQQDTITRGKHDLLCEVAEVSDGNHVAISDAFCSEGVRYLRGQDLKDFFISDTDPLHIPVSEYKKLTRSHMKPGDVLVGVVGTIGNIGLVTDRHGPLTGNCKLAILRPNSMEPEYLAAFLASSLGQNELQRRIRGTVQMGLILPDLNAIPIPLIAEKKRRCIVDAVRKSYSRRQDSLSLYAQAEGLLLSELGLGDLDLSPTLFYERDFSEAQQAARLDAEFFQPKYYRLLEKINACPFPSGALGDLIEPIKNGFDCRDYGEEGLPYIRVSDVSKGRIDVEGAKRIGISWKDVKKDIRLKKGDVLLTRKGSYGNAAFVRRVQSESVISSEIMLLRVQDSSILPEYLTVYLNSPAGFQQVERFVHGVAFYSISQPDLASVRVVRAPKQLQKRIADLVHKSDTTRDESRRLLEQAKRMVEDAVLGDKR